MGEILDRLPTEIIGGLQSLPLEPEDLALITQIIVRRLEEKGVAEAAELPTLNILARNIFQVSHKRNEILGESCCPDPEWNMLLDLIVAHTESRSVDVCNLCFASGVPRATALRHIERMTSAGLVKRRPCKNDRRRIWVDPTPRAISAIGTLLWQFCEAARSGTPLRLTNLNDHGAASCV